MARQRENTEAKKYPYGGRVEGNLAYDFDYEEKRAQRTEHSAEEKSAPRKAQRQEPQVQTTVRTRARQKVSHIALAGFVALAALVLVLVMSYAKLTAISSNVVSMKNELTALQAEHVTLLTRYEQTFDLSAIKEAAEATGMAKPSASQIFYVDLSEPDSAVVYQSGGSNIFSRIFTSLGHGMCSVVEYFK